MDDFPGLFTEGSSRKNQSNLPRSQLTEDERREAAEEQRRKPRIG